MVQTPTTNIINSEVLTVFVARTPGAPVTDRLFVFTGIAETGGITTALDNIRVNGALQFPLPDKAPAGGGQPGPHAFDGEIINLVATAALASIDTNSSDTALWAVDKVDTFLSDPESHQVFLNLTVAIGGGPKQRVHLYRVAYQAIVQVGPSNSSPPIS